MAFVRQRSYQNTLFKLALFVGIILCLRKFAFFPSYYQLNQKTCGEPCIKFNDRFNHSVLHFHEHPRKAPGFNGTWSSSFVSPDFHPHYNVNCSALVYGNRSVVDETNAKLLGLRKTGIPVPSDTDVITWTNDCQNFKMKRKYSAHPRSREEWHYPIAYIILTHKDAAQAERLLRAIYEPQNVYCIHPDAKSSKDFIKAIFGLAKCFRNVFIPSKLERVQYRGITRLKADINCMKDLLVHPVKWKYVINLCGQDFPLKTNLEIVRQLKAFREKNDVEARVPPPNIAGRTKFKFRLRTGYDLPVNTGIAKTPPPHHISIYFGNAYVAVTRAFVQFVIHDREAKDLLHWFSDTWSPDENFWATLHRHPRAPGGLNLTTKRTLVKMMRWGDTDDHPPCQGVYVRALCVFGVGYLNYLTSIPHLFANKFHYSYDPVNLQCIEELLDYRAQFPQTTCNFVKDFPAKIYPWYDNTTRGVDTVF